VDDPVHRAACGECRGGLSKGDALGHHARKEELCESTWAIVQDRHPFRDLTNESDLKHQLRRKLFILAENSYLEDLDGLQRSVLEAFARGVDY